MFMSHPIHFSVRFTLPQVVNKNKSGTKDVVFEFCFAGSTCWNAIFEVLFNQNDTRVFPKQCILEGHSIGNLRFSITPTIKVHIS